MRDRLELFCRHFSSVRRIVLVNHEECAYYRWLADRIPGLTRAGAGDLAHRPRQDLETVAEVFRRTLPTLRLAVELYHARFANEDHSKVIFEPVPADGRSYTDYD